MKSGFILSLGRLHPVDNMAEQEELVSGRFPSFLCCTFDDVGLLPFRFAVLNLSKFLSHIFVVLFMLQPIALISAGVLGLLGVIYFVFMRKTDSDRKPGAAANSSHPVALDPKQKIAFTLTEKEVRDIQDIFLFLKLTLVVAPVPLLGQCLMGPVARIYVHVVSSSQQETGAFRPLICNSY